MISIPPNVRHVFFVVVIALSGAVTALQSHFAWGWLALAASVLAGLGAVFTEAPGTAARMAALRACSSSPDQVRRTPTGRPPLGGAAALLPLALVAGTMSQALAACSGSTISPQTSTDIAVGVQAAACVVTNTAADLAAGDSPAQVVADVVQKCGVSVAQVATLLDSVSAAQDKVGGAEQVKAKFAAVSAAAHAQAQAAATDGGGAK